MPNVASLLPPSISGKAVKSAAGTGRNPAEVISSDLSGQKTPFLKTLASFLEDKLKPEQPTGDQTDSSSANFELQELPPDGNGLPNPDTSISNISLTDKSTSEISTSELKEIIKQLTTALSDINNNENLSHDQKSATEGLIAQLKKLQDSIQESPDESDITIPAGLASNILNTVHALRESGALESQRSGGVGRDNIFTSAITNLSGQDTGITDDIDKTSTTQNEAKIAQLSNIVQDLVTVSKEHVGTKADVGFSDLLKITLPATETRSSDTLIGNITGVTSQINTPAGDKVMTSLPINSMFNQSGWGDEIGDRIKWMVNHNIQTAKLSLNPPQLGPIEVKITMQNDQMNLVFTAHHAAVRDALETSVPRLREMFGDSGLNLADVDISQHSFSDQHNTAPDNDVTYRYADPDEHDDVSAVTNTIRGGSSHQGLVDYYA